jgi:hypothetical protein
VDQDHRLAAAVILVVDLDRSAVLGSNSDAGHAHSSFLTLLMPAPAVRASVIR